MEVCAVGIPRTSRLVRYQGNARSRAHPAGGHRNLPHGPRESPQRLGKKALLTTGIPRLFPLRPGVPVLR